MRGKISSMNNVVFIFIHIFALLPYLVFDIDLIIELPKLRATIQRGMDNLYELYDGKNNNMLQVMQYRISACANRYDDARKEVTPYPIELWKRSYRKLMKACCNPINRSSKHRPEIYKMLYKWFMEGYDPKFTLNYEP